jgi:hypothetical protein
MVFERGHDAHRKWQGWWWDMGILRGMFECLICELYWEDESPSYCPRCDAGRNVLVYREVPVFADEYLIAGNADGDVFIADEWTLFEIKTIGDGTIRFEAPQLIKKYTYKHTDDAGKEHENVDWRALWNGIKYPFPNHLRQGMIYCLAKERDKIRFLYDPKFVTAWPKEFEIGFMPELIEDVLDDCLTVKAALEKRKPPKRPMWATEEHSTCAKCPFKKECYGRRHNSGTE